ncbi:MAG: type III-A CRISPR-associated protein Csm2 [Methanomicrobiales archaeon]
MSNGRRSNQRSDDIKMVIGKIDKIEMLKDLKAKDFADEGGYADLVAKNSRDLKTTQLRKFFGAIRDIEMEKDWDHMETSFYLLKPKLANSVGRKLIPQDFYQFMKVSMNKVDVGTEEEKVKNFKKLVEFVEAVVAYHKFYHPKA